MKNLKMFAIAVMAFAVMATGVRAAVTCTNASYSNTVDGELKCYTSFSTALTEAKIGDTIKLEGDSEGVVTETTAIVINKNVNIDLNGKTLKLDGAIGITVNSGYKLTLKGTGKVENTTSANTSLITVQAGATLKVDDSVNLVNNEDNAGNTAIDASAVRVESNNTANKTTVVFGKDVVVTSKLHGLVVGGGSTLATAKNIDITMRGTWTADVYVVKVNGYITYQSSNPVKIAIPEGTYTSNGASALYASGYAEWDIDNPTVKGSQAVTVRSGKVDISGGTFEATTSTNGAGTHDGSSNHAIAILGNEAVAGNSSYNDPKYIDVKISGGAFTAKTDDSYAIYIGEINDDTKLAISNGTFTSGKDSVEETQLPAMFINTNSLQTMLEKHDDIITGGTFTGGLVDEIEYDGKKYEPADVQAKLVKGEVNTEGGNTTVGTPSDEGQQPGSTEPGTTGDGNQGSTENVKNPETNDNILVYAGLGLVSLASVAFTAKKRED